MGGGADDLLAEQASQSPHALVQEDGELVGSEEVPTESRLRPCLFTRGPRRLRPCLFARGPRRLHPCLFARGPRWTRPHAHRCRRTYAAGCSHHRSLLGQHRGRGVSLDLGLHLSWGSWSSVCRQLAWTTERRCL